MHLAPIPLQLSNLESVKAALWDEVRASRNTLADPRLNSETRYLALGRANVAEQMLLRLGEPIRVTQTVHGAKIQLASSGTDPLTQL